MNEENLVRVVCSHARTSREICYLTSEDGVLARQEFGPNHAFHGEICTLERQEGMMRTCHALNMMSATNATA